MYTEEEYQRAINKIIARERGNKEKEINPLLATLKAVGFDGKTPQEVNQIRKKRLPLKAIRFINLRKIRINIFIWIRMKLRRTQYYLLEAIRIPHNIIWIRR